MTTSRLRNFILSAVLTGAFVALPAGIALAQYEPNEQPEGTPADLRQDTRQINWLQHRAEETRERLRQDIRRYGPNSPQAQADRRWLKTYRNQLRKLRRDRAHDRGLYNRRHHGNQRDGRR